MCFRNDEKSFITSGPDCASDLSLCWALIPEGTYLHVAAYKENVAPLEDCAVMQTGQGIRITQMPSRKPAYIILTPLNSTFI